MQSGANSGLSRRLQAVLRTLPGLENADENALLAFLADSRLEEIASIKGVGYKLVAGYALGNGRADEVFALLEGDWNIPDADRDALEVQYYHQRLNDEFASETFNDQRNISHLANLYALRRKLTVEVNEAPDSKRATVVRELSAIEGSITAMERHLEIDPATRSQRSAKEETADLVSDLVDTAVQYLAEEGSVHITDHGAAGYTIWHFPSAMYMPRCVNCGCQEFVFRSPWEDKDFPFRVASKQQMDNYVAASSFVPEGAPNIELFNTEEERIWPSSNDKS